MTPEQEKTLEELTVAITNHLTAMGWMEDKLLNEFVVVSSAQPMTDGEGQWYYLTESSTRQPFHHTIGLLHSGLKWHYDERDDGDSG